MYPTLFNTASSAAPSDYSVSKGVGIEQRLMRLWHWQSDALVTLPELIHILDIESSLLEIYPHLIVTTIFSFRRPSRKEFRMQMLMPDPLPESKFCAVYFCYFGHRISISSLVCFQGVLGLCRSFQGASRGPAQQP
jgi:hypothetical protein